MRRGLVFHPVVSLLVTTIPALVRAGSVDPPTELMMADQEANTLILGFLFGADPHSPLNFTSNVDSTGLAFSYSLNPGSTYLGQPISLNSSGSSDSTGTNWTLSAQGMLGSTAWSTTGTATITLQGNGFKIGGTYKFGSNGGDFHLQSLSTANGSSTDSGFFTKNGQQVPSSGFASTDKLVDGDWKLTTSIPIPPGLGITIESTGFSPPNGGTGSFTTTVVPEPSSLTLLLIGSCGVLGCRWCRRHA